MHGMAYKTINNRINGNCLSFVPKLIRSHCHTTYFQYIIIKVLHFSSFVKEVLHLNRSNGFVGCWCPPLSHSLHLKSTNAPTSARAMRWLHQGQCTTTFNQINFSSLINETCSETETQRKREIETSRMAHKFIDNGFLYIVRMTVTETVAAAAALCQHTQFTIVLIDFFWCTESCYIATAFIHSCNTNIVYKPICSRALCTKTYFFWSLFLFWFSMHFILFFKSRQKNTQTFNINLFVCTFAFVCAQCNQQSVRD